MRVLITRPLDAARETADKVAALGHEPVIAPFLETRFLHQPISGEDRAQAILFTSANAVAGFRPASDLRRRLVFAVGDATAEAARQAGFTEVESADGAAEDLIRLLRQRLSPRAGPLLFPRGRHVTADLTEALVRSGFALNAGVVYETRALEALDPALRTRLASGEIDAVLFFSPRTAKAFVRVMEKEGLTGRTERMIAVCLSQKIADAAAPLNWRARSVAEAPNQQALLERLAEAA